METKTTLSKSEELFIQYKNGMAGSGMTALIEAIFKLDRLTEQKLL